MKKLVLICAMVCMATSVMAKDVTVKGVPDSIQDAQVQEWVKIIVNRYANAVIKQSASITDSNDLRLDNIKPVTQETIDSAKKIVDDYCVANELEKVYDKAEEVVENE